MVYTLNDFVVLTKDGLYGFSSRELVVRISFK